MPLRTKFCCVTFLFMAALKLVQDIFRRRPRAHEVINCEIADVLSLEIFLIWLILMIIFEDRKKEGDDYFLFLKILSPFISVTYMNPCSTSSAISLVVVAILHVHSSSSSKFSS